MVLESTGAAHLKIYGAAQDPMPNLTGLAAAAVIFENGSVYRRVSEVWCDPLLTISGV
jgi:hypothetical protein